MFCFLSSDSFRPQSKLNASIGTIVAKTIAIAIVTSISSGAANYRKNRSVNNCNDDDSDDHCNDIEDKHGNVAAQSHVTTLFSGGVITSLVVFLSL